MPGKGYFLQMTGAILLGLATLAVAVLVVLALSPYILPFFSAILPFLAGVVLVIVVVIIIWIVLYIAAIIGVGLYFAIKHPMEVNKTSAGYEMDKVSEAGRREKGDSSGRKRKEEE